MKYYFFSGTVCITKDIKAPISGIVCEENPLAAYDKLIAQMKKDGYISIHLTKFEVVE